MKILIENNLKTLLLAIFILSIGVACNDEDTVTLRTGGIQKITDSYFQVTTPVVSFQAGTAEYEIDMNVISGESKVVRVDVYSTFNDAEAATGLSSDEVLLTSYNVTNGLKENISDSYTYDELKAGISLGDNSLPDSDFDLAVGAGWVLRIVGILDNGKEISGGSINVAVLSPFAGLYKVISSAYYRIGVEQDPWDDEERFIGSVDDKTFTYNDHWGPFSWTGESFRFVVDFNDNSITVPIADELFSGDRVINCTNDGGAFTNVSCAGSNILIPDLLTGKHKIKLTYGYESANGFREFDEVLEKK